MKLNRVLSIVLAYTTAAIANGYKRFYGRMPEATARMSNLKRQ
jgi:hypothetical protein